SSTVDKEWHTYVCEACGNRDQGAMAHRARCSHVYIEAAEVFMRNQYNLTPTGWCRGPWTIQFPLLTDWAQPTSTWTLKWSNRWTFRFEEAGHRGLSQGVQY